jgi:hypothetical protein
MSALYGWRKAALIMVSGIMMPLIFLLITNYLKNDEKRAQQRRQAESSARYAEGQRNWHEAHKDEEAKRDRISAYVDSITAHHPQGKDAFGHPLDPDARFLKRFVTCDIEKQIGIPDKVKTIDSRLGETNYQFVINKTETATFTCFGTPDAHGQLATVYFNIEEISSGSWYKMISVPH